MKRTMFAFAFLALSSVAYAQTPTDYTITHHLASNPNGASITTPYTFSKSSPAVQCGQASAPTPTTVVVNPRFIRWQDPDNATLECVFDKNLATTPLFTNPPIGGDYVVKMTAIAKVGSATLTSAPSDPSNPFVQGTIPPVVLKVKVIGS